MTAAEAAALVGCARQKTFGVRCSADPELMCTTCQVVYSFAELEREVERLRRENGVLRHTSRISCPACDGRGVAPELVPVADRIERQAQRWCVVCGGSGLVRVEDREGL